MDFLLERKVSSQVEREKKIEEGQIIIWRLLSVTV